MKDMHKQHFVVESDSGPITIEANHTYGDLHVLHVEFVLDEPHPPAGFKIEWNKGKALVMFVKTSKDGTIPDLEIDNINKVFLRTPAIVEVKGSDGRIRKVGTHKREVFQKYKTVDVDQFAKLAGLVKPLKSAIPTKAGKND